MDPLDLDPTQPPPPIIERAYQLAASGLFSSISEICDRLIAERYEDVFLHFERRAAIRADLLRICREAQHQAAPGLRIASSTRATSAKRKLSRARRFDLKAAECRQLADNSVYEEPRRIFTRLAETYERLANLAEREEKEQATSSAKTADKSTA
jgi:hypothetical protein